MKIILLGASGQLGSEWKSWIEDHHSDDVDLQSYTSAELDITHYKEVSDELRRQKPEVVVNAAAYTKVDEAEEQRKLAHKVNVEAVLYLAELSNELEFKLVHFSTDYVFPGNEEDRKFFPNGYPEDHEADPINWYGKTKWEGEQAIRQTTENHLIIRVSWLCGQYGHNFVKTMLKLGQERDQLQVVNDQWGSPTFAENIVRNCWTLIAEGVVGTFHLTSNGLITWYDLAKEIFSQKGMEVEIEAVDSDAFPTTAKRPHFSKLSTQKISTIEGIQLIDWQEGLRDLLSQIK